MTQTRLDFEKDILNLSLALLDQYKDDLNASGIIRRSTRLKRNQKEGVKYLSEIEILLWDENNLDSIEEYFVWEGDKPSTSKDELKKWIEDFLKEVIEKRKDMQ